MENKLLKKYAKNIRVMNGRQYLFIKVIVKKIQNKNIDLFLGKAVKMLDGPSNLCYTVLK